MSSCISGKSAAFVLEIALVLVEGFVVTITSLALHCKVSERA